MFTKINLFGDSCRSRNARGALSVRPQSRSAETSISPIEPVSRDVPVVRMPIAVSCRTRGVEPFGLSLNPPVAFLDELELPRPRHAPDRKLVERNRVALGRGHAVPRPKRSASLPPSRPTAHLAYPAQTYRGWISPPEWRGPGYAFPNAAVIDRRAR
jgi:hypothetical protein